MANIAGVWTPPVVISGAVAWLLLAYLAGVASAVEVGADPVPELPLYAVPEAGAITLDGRLDEPAWQASPAWAAFGLDSGLGNLDLPTSVRFLRHGRTLCIGLACGLPVGRDGSPVAGALQRERLELWLDNTGEKRSFHHITIDPVAGGPRLASPGFAAAVLAAACNAQMAVVTDGYTLEIRIELDRFVRLGPPAAGRIGVNIARANHHRWGSLAGIIGNAHKPDEFIELDLTGRAEQRPPSDPFRPAFRAGTDVPALAEALAADWAEMRADLGSALPGWALAEVTAGRLRRLLERHRKDPWGLDSQLEVALYRALQARRDFARGAPATAGTPALRAIGAALRAWPDGAGPYPATAWREEAYVSEVDGTAQPYTLYVPPDYDPARIYPLVVDLHGSNQTHWGEGAVFSRYGRNDPRFLRVAVCSRGCRFYEPLALKDLWDVVAQVKAGYSIDAERPCFIGFSAGAFAIHRLALSDPDRIGAAAAVAGAGDGASAGVLTGLPLLLRHGRDDPVVRWDGAAGRTALLQEAGLGPSVELLPATGHAVSVSGLIDPLLELYGARRRQAERDAAPGPGPPSFPALVLSEADRPAPLWNRGVGLIALRDPVERAGVAIRADAAGTLAIRTVNIETFALDFGARDPGALRSLTIDGQALTMPTPMAGTCAVLRQAGSGWTLAFETQRPAPDPRAYRAGGVYTVYDGTPLLIVAPANRAAVAATLAGRLAHGPSAFVRIPIVGDDAVSEEQMQRCNLIVIGGPAENALARRLAAADSWPLPFVTGPLDPTRDPLAEYVPKARRADLARTAPDPPGPAPVPAVYVALAGMQFDLARFGVSLVTRNPLAPARRIWLVASGDDRGYEADSALLAMANWRTPAPDLRLVEVRQNRRVADWQLTRDWCVADTPLVSP